MKTTKGLNLREIIVMAAIAAVFGVLYLVWIFFGQFIQATFGPVGWGFISGFWIIAPILCAYIIRKPGVALIAELIAATIEVLVGSVNAGVVLLLGFTQGIGAELAFAIFLYRNYRLPVLMLAGIFGTSANFMTIYFLYGYSQYSNILTGLMFMAMVISGALIAGWGSKSIADGLSRTGVLANFALGKIYHEQRNEQYASQEQ
ncbi:ECF transporter S component [Salirhabdus salicampi]|uniref:ECF transporter S component n=1 Tax=Salirhabdus salicampi TaxID=476102 RepID=UPI0020C5B21D|nr:ECF transporter S component [Salirhabdus salicampi]MCP8615887.1 ECF transporter S component [Salirhabdus salicampi]